MTRISILLLSALALASCAEYQTAARAYIGQGVQATQTFKDDEARLAVQIACISGLGAVGRTWTPTQTYHILALCWPDGYAEKVLQAANANTTVNTQAVQAIVQLLNAAAKP